jgi:hypothetical protein
MSEQTPQRPQYGDDDCDKPKPTPDPEPKDCPDPCDTPPPWGPPPIVCCPPRDCCPPPKEGDKTPACTWDEVDDPCVRAASCTDAWTRITCTCKSSNEKCTCQHWDCGTYPQGTCVPCDPCKGLPTPPEQPPDGGPTDPNGDGCGAEELQRRLRQTKKAIQDAQNQKVTADRDLKAGQDSEKELTALIASLDALVKSYNDNLYKLKCREDCLKGFARDTAKLLASDKRFPKACLEKLRDAINKELCRAATIACCAKNLESKLTGLTHLAWAKQDAADQLKKAEEAFKAIKDLPKWIGDQFAELEAIRDQIVAALKDPAKQNHAFYLFYWKFLPGLCKRFKVPICCEKKAEGEAPAPAPARQGPPAPPTPVPPPPAFGCTPGDWHPSRLSADRLRALVCCALDLVNTRKKALQDATDAVDKVTQDLERVKAEIPDAKALDELIKSRIEKIKCEPAATGA